MMKNFDEKPKEGDRIVLDAKPSMTSKEMIAIWKLHSISRDYGVLYAEELGNRSYLLSWMRVYPKFEENAPSDADEADMPF